jgi:hypothetical protein
MGSGTGPPLKPPGRPRTNEASVRASERAVLRLLTRGPRAACAGLSVSAHAIASLRKRMGIGNESNQDNRAISTGKLNALLRLHTRPINVVVYHGSQGRTRFEVGFSLRCLQRLSRPHVATLHCRWRDNSSTRGASIPVLSY